MMRPNFLLIALISTLAVAARVPYKLSDYISDCIGSFCYYTFTISYTPPPPHTYNIPLSEPAFSTHCQYSTDDGANYVSCKDNTVETIGVFTLGEDLKLTVVHTWTAPATAARVAGTLSRTAKKTVSLYLGSTGTPASFQMTGGSEVFTPTVSAVPVNKRSEGKARRDELRAAEE